MIIANSISSNGFYALPVDDDRFRWRIHANDKGREAFQALTGQEWVDGVRQATRSDIVQRLDFIGAAAAGDAWPVERFGAPMPIAAPEYTDYPGVAPILAAMSIQDNRNMTSILPCRNWGWGRCDLHVMVQNWHRLRNDDLCPECHWNQAASRAV